MKKLSVLLMSICGATALVACGSGSSSSGGGGGIADTPQPTKYSESIPTGGTLISLNNLYLATDATDAPLSFGVESITADTTVSFTVQANNSTSSGKLQATTMPTLSPDSCTFDAANPQPCTININASGVPAESYIIVPIVGVGAMPPISVTTQSASSVTLPNGEYTAQIIGTFTDGITCELLTPITASISVSGNQMCTPGGCKTNKPVPVPSGANPFTNGFMFNVSWTGTVLTLDDTSAECPGLIGSVVLTKK